MPATPATVDRFPNIDFAEIERYVESSAKMLPLIAMFFPAAKKAIPYLPIMEEVLEIMDEIDHAADEVAVQKAVADGLRRMSDRLKPSSG